MRHRPGVIVRAALNAAYPPASALYAIRGRLKAPTRELIVVYQMAKVGSTSVARSLRKSQRQRPVHSVHTLTDQGVETLTSFYRSTGVPFLPWGAHLLVSRYLIDLLRRGMPARRWKIVTLVRDPLARNLSLLFQLGRRLLPDFEARCDQGRLDPISIFGQFGDRFPAQVECLRWFREELEPVTGVDVFASAFDHDRGYQVYHGPFADVLLVKTERLDEVGPSALTSFLGLDRFVWDRRNVRTEGDNGDRYGRFLESLVLPEEFVERVYRDPAVRHFYGPDELDQLRDRWTDPRQGVA